MRALPPLLLLLVAGCAPLGPDYVRPQVETPAAFRFAEGESEALANAAWWEQFDDPALDDLIAEALVNNRDLRIAAARVDEFAGRLAVARSAFFPQTGYQLQSARDRSSERLATPVPPSIANPQTSHAAVLAASWEIDLWGRLRRLDEAARADPLASEEGRRGVVLSLVASVANGYLALRSLDRQLEIARQTAKSREDALHLFEIRHDGGLVSQLELSQVRSEYEAASAQVTALENSVSQAEHALSYLLGRPPGPIRRGKEADELADFGVPAGLPSDLLERRPDIRQAEQNLISANARIGAARALYYPSISLTGLFGGASEELGDLFSGPARTWSFAGSLIGPLFTFGAVSGQVEQAEARQRQLLAEYEQAIQNAFREVDDALVDHLKSRERAETQLRQVAALRDYARLARLRYENGYTSYLEVLDAERSLFNVELEYTQTRGDTLAALVNVYKAMGGGWVETLDRQMHPPGQRP